MVHALLVEDHDADAVLLTELLEMAGAGWEVERVETFAQASLRWQEGQFDVLLLDLDVPDGFGLDLLARALQLAGKRPVCVLSGLTNDTVAARALEMGARGYVVKGLESVPELLKLVGTPA